MWLVGLSLCGFYLSFVWVIVFPGSFETARGLASQYGSLVVRVLWDAWYISAKCGSFAKAYFSDWF